MQNKSIDINVLGINESHNATACILKNGVIVACASEERFNRKKNTAGYPDLAVQYCLIEAGITSKELDLVVVSFQSPMCMFLGNEEDNTKISLLLKNINKFTFIIYQSICKIELYFPPAGKVFSLLHGLYKKYLAPQYEKHWLNKIADSVCIDKKKIYLPSEHHLTHAFSLFSIVPKDVIPHGIIVTHDGMGDDICSLIGLYDNSPEGVNIVDSTPNYHSLAELYRAITIFLGMKPNEHEYKVMGLAPYADKNGLKKTLILLKDATGIDVKSLKFKSKISSRSFVFLLDLVLKRNRFDWVAGAIQKLTEELLVKLVNNAMKIVSKNYIFCSGGIFMNVKANKNIMEIPELKKVFFMPSCGDESSAIGAAYYGYRKLCRDRGISFDPHIVENFYLGPSFSNSEVMDVVERYKLKNRYTVERIEDIEKYISNLLASGNIVARFQGRMEFGARALGNRSILADPSRVDLVRVLNDQVKNRDFWMPFAPTILREREKDYIINPKSIESPYMMVAFDTTELGREHLKAAMHPYDNTVRAQILRENDNPKYYKLIKSFENSTEIGGILNTSFNLHGEPIVCTPEDALDVFKRSGLKILAIENYLITKKDINAG